jgi:ubiquinone/menaquinone biosynthesis C-methylase UbiE
MSSDEASRIRAVYAQREATGAEERYAYWHSANFFLIQQLEKAIVQTLQSRDLLPLTERRVLDVGCGDGFWLRFLLRLGAGPTNLYGIDLLENRVEQARLLAPNMDLRVGDATALPYRDEYFDIVTQFTMFTSILSPDIKQRIAGEMLRVLQPGGIVLWYDFVMNPRNKDTQGIGASQLRALFPDCDYRFSRVTLAPPLTRLLARRSWLACYLLEKVPLLRTHYLTAITKRA